MPSGTGRPCTTRRAVPRGFPIPAWRAPEVEKEGRYMQGEKEEGDIEVVSAGGRKGGSKERKT